MDRRKQALLLYLENASEAHGAVDPVRIMKGMFLLTRKYLPLEGAYDFQAYNYGPFTPEVYRDLDELIDQGFVASHPVAGRTWSTYSLTQSGLREAQAIAQGDAALLDAVMAVIAQIAGKSFPELLRDIYREYPAFAVNTAAPNLRS